MASVDYKRELKGLMQEVIDRGASDLHFSLGSQPILRYAGSLVPLVDKPILTEQDLEGFMTALLPKKDYEKFLEVKEVDFSYSVADGHRFRGNGAYQFGSITITLRLIPNEIKSFEELGLPPILESFATRNQGFFLCVGPVGQGKSTTLAAIVEHINQHRADHIVTIEEPIEYVYEPKRALIEQREWGLTPIALRQPFTRSSVKTSM